MNITDVVAQNEATTDRIFEKVSQHLIIDNSHGIAVKSSYDNTTTQGIIKNVAGTVVNIARSCVRDVDPSDDLCFLRINTKKCEFLISPEIEFTLVVQQ